MQETYTDVVGIEVGACATEKTPIGWPFKQSLGAWTAI
jgi:hypothetical protein